MKAVIEYICCPQQHFALSMRPVRQWLESHCEGSVLNLFAGRTKLNVEEIRNDIDDYADADFHMDARDFLKNWGGAPFDTILLNPTGVYRTDSWLKENLTCFSLLKDALIKHLKPAGKVISFGYHAVVMGPSRGFELEKIGLFSHGGAIHDTIASVERYQL